MPDFCSAYGCSHERSVQTRSQGITFHRFPKNGDLRKRWEKAVRRVNFVATKRSLLCSQHFRPQDFDMTGQIVRLRADVVPSVFNFPTSLQKRIAKKTTSSQKKEDESQPLDLTKRSSKVEPPPNNARIYDHNYALPTSPSAIKAKLNEAFARVETLEREKRNAKIRELRAKKNMDSALEDLRRKNLVNKKLRAKLEHFSGTRVSSASPSTR